MKINIKKSVSILLFCTFVGMITGCGGGGGGSGDVNQQPVYTDLSVYENISGVPALSLGKPVVSTDSAIFPLVIANTQGKTITSVAAEIGYEFGKFVTPSTVIGQAASDAGKAVSSPVLTTQSGGIQRMQIAITNGVGIIGDGVVAYLKFSFAQGAMPSNYSYVIVPQASSSAGPQQITGTK